MATVANVNTYADAAIAAVLAGDLATAATQARAAQIALATLPDARSDSESLTWDRESIATLIKEIKTEQNSIQGIQTSKTHYARATD